MRRSLCPNCPADCVVALGGGTGLSTLRGLKGILPITAVVAVTDDGEAQAVRKEMGVLPLEIFEIVWLHWQMLSRS